MRFFRLGVVLLFLISLSMLVMAQKPFVFDNSDVVVGARRIPTLQFIAAGKWSDAGDNLGMDSTRIQCYKAFGFCEIAQAFNFNGNAVVNLDGFDILQWNDNELIATDGDKCASTLRVNFKTELVTISSSTDKGEFASLFCTRYKLGTAVLWTPEDVVKDLMNKAKSKK
jgi:hypothetical protein